jgi:hypothetical protein
MDDARVVRMNPDDDGGMGPEVPLRVVTAMGPEMDGLADVGPPEAWDVEGQLARLWPGRRRGLDDADAGILHELSFWFEGTIATRRGIWKFFLREKFWNF